MPTKVGSLEKLELIIILKKSCLAELKVSASIADK
jgi:hypothetical protein